MLKQFFFSFLFLFLVKDLYARPATNFERVQEAVSAKEKELQAISASQVFLQKKIKELKQRLKELDAYTSNLEKELNNISVGLKKVKNELEKLEEKRLALKEKSLARLRLLYMKKDDFQMMRLALFSNSDEFLRDSFFLSKYEQRDRKILDAVSLLSQQKRKALLSEKNLKEERKQVIKTLEKERKKVEQGIKEQHKLQKKLEVEQHEKEQVLTVLRVEALRLETVVRSLTGEQSDIVHKKKDVVAKYGDAAKGKFAGKGLKKGKLIKPVPDSIVKKFGEKSENFSGMVTSKGWWFASPLNRKVQAIASGRVMYIGKMPAYGTIVILDHGERLYSMYGQLKNVAVEVGDDIKAGSVIALVGGAESRSNKARFYFEIRKQGLSVDPAKYY